MPQLKKDSRRLVSIMRVKGSKALFGCLHCPRGLRFKSPAYLLSFFSFLELNKKSNILWRMERLNSMFLMGIW